MNKKVSVMVLSSILLCSSIFIFLHHTDTVQATLTNWDGPPNPNTYDDDFLTVAVLPDTQGYTDDYPAVFDMQTQWIVDHKDDWNIQFVSHLGDIVDTWVSST